MNISFTDVTELVGTTREDIHALSCSIKVMQEHNEITTQTTQSMAHVTIEALDLAQSASAAVETHACSRINCGQSATHTGTPIVGICHEITFHTAAGPMPPSTFPLQTITSTLRGSSCRSNLRSDSTSSSYEDALPVPLFSSEDESGADDSDSDALPPLLDRPPEERPYAIPAIRPVFDPPVLGYDEIVRVQPDYRLTRTRASTRARYEPSADVEQWDLRTERELLVNYGQMVMEASDADEAEDEARRGVYAQLAEDLLMDTVDVDVE